MTYVFLVMPARLASWLVRFAISKYLRPSIRDFHYFVLRLYLAYFIYIHYPAVCRVYIVSFVFAYIMFMYISRLRTLQ